MGTFGNMNYNGDGSTINVTQILTTTNRRDDEETSNQIADFQNDSFVIQPDQFMTPDKSEEKQNITEKSSQLVTH